MPTNFDESRRGSDYRGGGGSEGLGVSLASFGKSVKINPYTDMGSKSQDPSLTLDERLRILYPMVDEDVSPLPRCWSMKDRFNFIGLSNDYLRVQYKGNGKSHKEASSVRATHPIPASCGIYYFEVRIVSKGRDGYMGVGLSAQGVNMNRLPGWDKHSYGYHGDDGNSFCSSGTGQPYGPTFTTGDVIGCGLNLIDRSCFYTKNGHNLGNAFKDLPSNLYPTVGLQTPGEVIDANFGQEPFVFDIEGEMREKQTRIHHMIQNFPAPGKHGDWQLILNRMVSSYLVHQGFCATAEAFVKSTSTGQEIEEDFPSIRNRQAIQKLVLAGRMGEAISMTNKLYPDFLQSNPSLHFMLKVRQFIEMVGGHDECDGDSWDDEMQITNGDAKSSNNNSPSTDTEDTISVRENSDNQMEVDQPTERSVNGNAVNGNEAENGRNLSIVNNPVRFGKLIQFGRQLQTMLQFMEVSGSNPEQLESNRKMQQDAFALVAYPDPWDSPVGWQLDPKQREHVSSTLNSEILEKRLKRQPRPPLEVSLHHAKNLVKQMAGSDLGACAFANIDDFI